MPKARGLGAVSASDGGSNKSARASRAPTAHKAAAVPKARQPNRKHDRSAGATSLSASAAAPIATGTERALPRGVAADTSSRGQRKPTQKRQVTNGSQSADAAAAAPAKSESMRGKKPAVPASSSSAAAASKSISGQQLQQKRPATAVSTKRSARRTERPAPADDGRELDWWEEDEVDKAHLDEVEAKEEAEDEEYSDVDAALDEQDDGDGADDDEVEDDDDGLVPESQVPTDADVEVKRSEAGGDEHAHVDDEEKDEQPSTARKELRQATSSASAGQPPNIPSASPSRRPSKSTGRRQPQGYEDEDEDDEEETDDDRAFIDDESAESEEEVEGIALGKIWGDEWKRSSRAAKRAREWEEAQRHPSATARNHSRAGTRATTPAAASSVPAQHRAKSATDADDVTRHALQQGMPGSVAAATGLTHAGHAGATGGKKAGRKHSATAGGGGRMLPF